MKCRFCDFKDEYLIIKDYKYWTLFLAEGQSPIGWSIVFLKRHIEFFEEVKDEELSELKLIIKEVKFVLNRLFQPSWFNIMQLGNIEKHLHVHLVPRYKNEIKYDKRTFVDTNYGKMIEDKWKPESKEFLIRLVKDIKDNL